MTILWIKPTRIEIIFFFIQILNEQILIAFNT